jgi:lantibiotic transport system permease protein
MFLRALVAEQMKLQRSPVWLAFFFLPILPAFMGTFNYLQNLSILQDQWYSLWSQETLFSCYFFLPAILAIYCSYLLRLEHTHYNWNMVMTAPVRVRDLYLAKLLSAVFMVVMTQTWIGALFVISGKLIGLNTPIPPELPAWLLFGACGGMVICGLQLCLSLVIRSFAVPVGLALAGGIAGLAAIAKGFGLWVPYALLSLGMRANSPETAMPCTPGQFLATCAGFLLVFFLFAVIWLKVRDVEAG